MKQPLLQLCPVNTGAGGATSPSLTWWTHATNKKQLISETSVASRDQMAFPLVNVHSIKLIQDQAHTIARIPNRLSLEPRSPRSAPIWGWMTPGLNGHLRSRSTYLLYCKKLESVPISIFQHLGNKANRSPFHFSSQTFVEITDWSCDRRLPSETIAENDPSSLNNNDRNGGSLRAKMD